MANHAVVPVKGLGTSKKRLSPVLSPPERKQLTLAMLANVLCALQIPAVSKTVVVSNDSGLKSVISKFNAYFLEQRTKGLNAALEETIEWCMKEGAKSVLVLPADIPLLSSTDVERILKMGTEENPQLCCLLLTMVGLALFFRVRQIWFLCVLDHTASGST